MDWLLKFQIRSYYELKISFWSLTLLQQEYYSPFLLCLALILGLTLWTTLEIAFQGTVRGLQDFKKIKDYFPNI